MADSGHQPSEAEIAWNAHYRRIYPEAVFTPEYMAGAYRPAFIQGKKAGFHCGWEEATEAAAEMPSFEHMEAVAKLSALRGAARAVLNESAEQTMDDPEPRDQRIKELEGLLAKANLEVLESHRLEDTYRPRGL